MSIRLILAYVFLILAPFQPEEMNKAFVSRYLTKSLCEFGEIIENLLSVGSEGRIAHKY